MTLQYPIFDSVAAFALGVLDLLRGVSLCSIRPRRAGSQRTNSVRPTRSDERFRCRKFLERCSLDLLVFRDRFGALLFLAVIPIAYLTTGIGLHLNGTDPQGKVSFPAVT